MAKRIIVALDYPNLEPAARMSNLLGNRFGYKVGLQLCTAEGVPDIFDFIGAEETFLDLKFKDIPNTVAGAVQAAALQGVWMMNLHIDGGIPMMKAAVNARNLVLKKTGHRSLLMGVTILTSHDPSTLKKLGIYREKMTVEEIVVQLAKVADQAGLDGVVCSPLEVEAVRRKIPHEHFQIVTPGIRDNDAPPDDQKRAMTAREAIDAGADYLVIGRPITQAPDPLSAAEKFLAECN